MYRLLFNKYPTLLFNRVKMQASKAGKWVLFILLSFIWGSSFILMKTGMEQLSAWQVASLRIFVSGLVLLPIAVKNFRKIPTSKIGLVFLSGALGSLFPAYLFCLAEQKIDSGLAGALNAMTPVFTIVSGVLFFQLKTERRKAIGVFIALLGSALLFLSKYGLTSGFEYTYLAFIFSATLCYGINVNLVQRHLQGMQSLDIVAMALGLCAIPAFILLIYTGFFGLDFSSRPILMSVGYSVILGVVGTALASILFYQLIKTAGSVFASMVTYGIPFVALGWGLMYGEIVGWLQILGLTVILGGVYLANSNSSKIKR